MRPALVATSGVSMTRSTRTGRRGDTGGAALQLGRAGQAGDGLGWLARLGTHAAAGREAGEGRDARMFGALAVSQPTKPWNEPSKPVGENDAIPIGPPQQAC